MDCPEVPSETTATILVSKASRLQFFRRLTHFECFGCRRSRVLLLHSSLLRLRSEMVHTYLFACHSGCHELVSLLVKQSKMWRKRSCSADFLCTSVTNLGAKCHKPCGVHILKGYCCVHFRIQCCESSVFPNQFLSSCFFHIPLYVLGRLMWSLAWIFHNFLTACTISACCALISPWPYTSVIGDEFRHNKYFPYIKKKSNYELLQGPIPPTRCNVKFPCLSPNLGSNKAQQYNHLRRNKKLDEPKRYGPGGQGAREPLLLNILHPNVFVCNVTSSYV
jgi:hypothetical protein